MDLLAVQGTLKSLLQHHSSKASILRCSAFFIVQLSHPYMTSGKTITLTRRTFVGKVMSLLFNIWSSLVITFLPRSKCVLISWLQSPSAVILELKKIKSVIVSIVSLSIPACPGEQSRVLSPNGRGVWSIEAAQGAPRDPRRDSTGERNSWLSLETRPYSPGEPGMQPRDPCLPWRGILGPGHTPR